MTEQAGGSEQSQREEAPNEFRLTKRTLLMGSLAPLAAVAGIAYAQQTPPTTPPRTGPRIPPKPGEIDARLKTVQGCVLTPQSVEGPFYFDSKILRTDIREDQTGTPLIVEFEVSDANDCKPIAGALVSVWHCNASGSYSGYTDSNPDIAVPFPNSVVKVPHQDPHTPERWLRGAASCDESGKVTFKTIFPSWYLPRAPHIHVKAFLKGGSEVITTQFYFPQSVINDVLNKGVYAKRGAGMITNENDVVRKQSGGGPTFDLSVGADGVYIAKGILGVAHA